jgi:hypothetical protein
MSSNGDRQCHAERQAPAEFSFWQFLLWLAAGEVMPGRMPHRISAPGGWPALR